MDRTFLEKVQVPSGSHKSRHWRLFSFLILHLFEVFNKIDLYHIYAKICRITTLPYSIKIKASSLRKLSGFEKKK